MAHLRLLHLVSQGKADLKDFFGNPDEVDAAAVTAVSEHLGLLEARLPAVLQTLTRRRASGTLLPGRCRAHEVSWYAEVLRADWSHFPAEQLLADKEAALLLSAQLVGVDIYFDAAQTVTVALPALLETNLSGDLFLVGCLMFVEHALHLVLQRARSGEEMRPTSTESFL